MIVLKKCTLRRETSSIDPGAHTAALSLRSESAHAASAAASFSGLSTASAGRAAPDLVPDAGDVRGILRRGRIPRVVHAERDDHQLRRDGGRARRVRKAVVRGPAGRRDIVQRDGGSVRPREAGRHPFPIRRLMRRDAKRPRRHSGQAGSASMVRHEGGTRLGQLCL